MNPTVDTTKNMTAKRYPNKIVKEKSFISLPILPQKRQPVHKEFKNSVNRRLVDTNPCCKKKLKT